MAEAMRALHTAANLPLDASALKDTTALYCYFARITDNSGQQLTQLLERKAASPARRRAGLKRHQTFPRRFTGSLHLVPTRANDRALRLGFVRRTALAKHLLLVDYENVPRIDLSVVDETYKAIVFVGAGQNPPRAAMNRGTAHRFRRVDFQRIAGSGKNALDFHIAFHLGRVFETSPETICIVVSRDKGFDPLLLHLNNNGLQCRRIDNFAELAPTPVSATPLGHPRTNPEMFVCARCKQSRTIELHGGRWCVTCGSYASPPDPKLLPSNQPGYRDREPARAPVCVRDARLTCGWCHQPSDMADGIYDDGEWMCGSCIAQVAN
jgi:hypothetical protein